MYKSQEFFKYTVVYAWYVMCARGSTDIMRLYVLMINHLNTKEILIAFGTTEIRQYQKKIIFQYHSVCFPVLSRFRYWGICIIRNCGFAWLWGGNVYLCMTVSVHGSCIYIYVLVCICTVYTIYNLGTTGFRKLIRLFQLWTKHLLMLNMCWI